MKPFDSAHQGAGRVANAVETIATWLSDATRGRDGVGQWDPRDIESMARDIGLSAPELARAVAGSNGSTAELTQLLKQLSLDPREVSAQEPGTMRDLSRLCAGCADKRRCNHDLKAGVAAETYRDYCPNGYTIDALVEEHKRKV